MHWDLPGSYAYLILKIYLIIMNRFPFTGLTPGPSLPEERGSRPHVDGGVSRELALYT
jgi:hypothetical protein